MYCDYSFILVTVMNLIMVPIVGRFTPQIECATLADGRYLLTSVCGGPSKTNKSHSYFCLFVLEGFFISVTRCPWLQMPTSSWLFSSLLEINHKKTKIVLVSSSFVLAEAKPSAFLKHWWFFYYLLCK